MTTYVKKQSTLTAIIVALIASFVIGSVCLVSSAFADNTDTQTASAQAKLVATYNNDGTITVPNTTIKNDTDYVVTIDNVSIESEYDFVKDWSNDAVGKTIQPGESLTVSWTAKTSVPSDFNGESEVYVGTITYDYSFKKALPDDISLNSDEYTYDGSAKTPEVKGLEDLVEGSDYTIEYKNNTNAGTATATITGIGDYTGTKTLEFTINPASIADTTVTIPDETYYTGNKITPEVSVALGGKTLTANTDYTLSGDTSKTDAGTYTITVIGKGNYTGSTPAATWTIKANAYWLGKAGDETSIIETQGQIEEDMAVLHNEASQTSSGEDYDAVKTKYEGYMNADGELTGETHLYTKWYGDDVTDETSKNKYVEFRIIQVGEHDNDGSAVTFMATHSLPTAKAMNMKVDGSATNSGGWTGSEMYNTVFASGGYVQTGLSDLVNSGNVKAVTKKSTAGSYDTSKIDNGWEEATTNDSFWLLSFSEIADEDTYPILWGGFKNEGSQYAWFAKKEINPTGSNDAIENMDETRSGNSPAGASAKLWWERSPLVSGSGSFGLVDSDGDPSYSDPANYTLGVVPAFSF